MTPIAQDGGGRGQPPQRSSGGGMGLSKRQHTAPHRPERRTAPLRSQEEREPLLSATKVRCIVKKGV